MKKLTGFVITAGHLDIEWYQPLRSYRFWTMEALEDLKNHASRRADFQTYVLDGQFFPLEEYLEVVPGDEELMRELVRDGKLTIGPFYTQFDEWLPSAESMIRNCLWGKRRSENFGGFMRAGYLPDNFGHPRQLPQILAGFGLDSLLFMRGMPEIPGGHPDEFLYEGLDGARVLVSHFRESYSGAFDIFSKKIDPIQLREVPYYPHYESFEWHKELAVHDDPERIATNMIANVRRIQERYPSGVIPLIAGFDHLPPQINIGDSIAAANRMQDQIEFVMGSAGDYVQAVQSRLHNPAVYRMELLGSRYQYVLLGALSTRSYLKRMNFAAEALVERYAEPLEALAMLYNYQAKPKLLEEAWRFLLINSAHDSIHGSSVDEVHVEMESRYAGVRQIAAGLIHETLSFLGGKLKSWWSADERGVLAYAPVRTAFAQALELWLPIGDQPATVVDQSGKSFPSAVLPREIPELNGIGLPRNKVFPDQQFRKVLFLAPLDTVTEFAVKPVAGPAFDMVAGGDRFLENEFLRVEIAGALLHICDKRTGRWFHNLNLLEEEADAGDAWDFSPPWTPGEVVRSTAFPFHSRLIEQNPVRAVIEQRGTLSVPAELVGDRRSAERREIPVTFRITLYGGIDRVEVKLTFENNARDHRIRLRLPAGVKTGTILSQGHLAILERPVDPAPQQENWVQPPTRLFPCREWIAAADSQAGLAVGLKGLYDYEAISDPLTGMPDLAVTLLRGIGCMERLNTKQRMGGASPSVETPGAQCPGLQEIEWAFVPYCVSRENRAPFLPQIQSFLYPPAAHAIRRKPVKEGREKIPAPFHWTAENLQFSAFKAAENGDGYILRFYENQGKAVQAEIQLAGFSRAWLADLAEQPLEELAICGNTVKLPVAAYKAITLKLMKN